MSVLADDAIGTGGRGGADAVRSTRGPHPRTGSAQPRPGRLEPAYLEPVHRRGRARHPGVRPAVRPKRGVQAPRVARLAPCATQVRPRRWPWLLVVGVSMFLGVFGIGSLAEGTTPPVPERTTVVSIAPGETLWRVASKFAPDSERQAVIDRIRELNGLSGSSVHPGQLVRVPAQAGGAEAGN